MSSLKLLQQDARYERWALKINVIEKQSYCMYGDVDPNVSEIGLYISLLFWLSLKC